MINATADTRTVNKPTKSAARSSTPLPVQQRLRGSCDRCQEAKLKCSRDQPTCARCASHKITCVYSFYRRVGRPRKALRALTQAQQGDHNNDSIIRQLPGQQAPEGSSPNPGSVLYEGADASRNLFDLATRLDGDGWGMGMPNLGSPPAMFLDSYDWARAGLGPSDELDDGNGMPIDPRSLGVPLSSSMADGFSFAFAFGVNAFGKGLGLGRPTGEDVLSSLSSAENSGSSSGSTDVMMLDLGQKTDKIGTDLSSADSPMLKSLSRSRGFTCQNQCIELVSRQLGALASQPSGNITMDTMLAMEKAIVPIHRAVCSCAACVDNVVVMLLLTMLIEQTVALFEKLSDCRHLAGNEPFDASQMMAIESSLMKRGANAGASDGGGSREITSKSALLLGRYEVDKVEKSAFLTKVLRLRLTRTARLLLELQERVTSSSLASCNALAARSIAKSAYGRTEVLLGMLEMWKGPLR